MPILFKLEFLGRKVWCRMEAENISHENLKEIGKKKFDIDCEEGPVLFYDTEGVLVDDDFLPSFFKMDDTIKTLVMHTSKSAYNIKNLNDNNDIMTDTLTNNSSISNNSLTNIMPSEDPSGNTLVISLSQPLSTDFIETPKSTILMPPPSPIPTTTAASVREPTLNISGNIKPEELKQQIIAKQGNILIFDEYERLKCLTNQTRKLLVNVVCDLMVDRYGLYNIPTRIKEEYAKCIIEIFPSLRDPFGIKGYEMFFNSQKHDGFLVWRLKTLSRKSSCNKKISNTAKRPRLESLDQAECSNNYDITETIEELRKANPRTDIDEIMKKMADSFVQRRKRPMENVLIYFPRFIDTPGLIEQDFSLLHPNKPTLSECFGQFVEKILDIYVKTSKQINNELLEENEDNKERWPKSVRALLAILYMLPPTAKGKKAANNNNVASASKKLILFKKNNVPLSTIVNPHQKQPYLIAEGLSMGELLTYHVVVDQTTISLENISCPLEAFDILFMCHFVFNIEYDQALINFWTFIQWASVASWFFKPESSVFSKMATNNSNSLALPSVSSSLSIEPTKPSGAETAVQILRPPSLSSVRNFNRKNYQPPRLCTQIHCTVPNCKCENFVPGKIRLRYCESCNHGWVPHALDKLGLRHLFNISAPEPVHVNVAFDVASLILYGCQALPIRLKILLDRLFSVLQKDEVIQVLHGFGWTIDDYARGYILQESHGSTLDRWSFCNPEEEPLVLQQFLRFEETRAITQQLLLAQQALQDRTLERLERRHSPHPRAMSPSRRPSPPNVPPSVFHSQVHAAMSPHQKHPLGFLKMPPVSSGPISSTTPPNNMASSPLNRLQSMTFDYRKLTSAGLPTFPNRVSPDIGRRRTNENEPVGLNLSISTSLSNCLPPPHPPTSLSHSAAAMAVSANALAAANLVASSFPGLMSTRMSSGSKSPSSAELFPGNNNSEDDDDADENSHSALNLSRDRDSLKTPKQPRMLPGRKPSTPTKRQWGSPSLPLNLGTQFINPATGKKRVQCNVCLKTFCDKGALKIHFSAVHLREMHKCTVEGCNMMFSSRRSRNRHSANPNPKLHSPHLRRKISPHDGRSSQSHPMLIPPQTGLGLPAAATLNPLNPFGPFPLLTPPPDMKYHSLATMDFKQSLDLSIQRSMEENKNTVKDFSALALTSSNHHHHHHHHHHPHSEEEDDDEEGIVVVGGDEDDEIPHDKTHIHEREEIKQEQKNPTPVSELEHPRKSRSPESRRSKETFEVAKEIPRIHSPLLPPPPPISDQPEDFSMPAKKQKMSISDADEEVLSNVDSNEDSLSVVDNHSLKDEPSNVQTNKRKRKSQNPTRCAIPIMMDDPVSDGDSSNDVFAERLAESTRRLEMEAKIEPKKEIKMEEDRCESPLDLGKRSPDVNANEPEKTIGNEIKTSLAPLFLIDKLKKEKLYHDSDAQEEHEERPASSVESNKSDESFDFSNPLRHLESLSHGNFSEWMSKGIHLGLGAPGSQFPPLGFMMGGGPPSPARSQASSPGSSNGGESPDENSQNQLFGHFDNGQFISTMDVPIDKDNPRRCTACGKIFQNHFGVKTHYQNVHLKLMHKCNVDGCNAAFPSKRSRDRHSANLNLHRKLLSTTSEKGGSGLSHFASFAANPALHGDFLARLYADEAFKSHNLPPNIDQLMLNGGDRIPPPPLLLPPPLGVLPFPLGNFGHFGQFNGSAVGKERSSTSSSPVSSSPPPSNLPPSPLKYSHCVEEDLPTPDKEGNLPCRFCRTSFSTPSQLKEHCEKNHLSEMFKCTIIGCPKVFVSRTRRNIHSENESLHVNLLKKESDVS